MMDEVFYQLELQDILVTQKLYLVDYHVQSYEFSLSLA